MAKRLRFEEFHTLLTHGLIPPELLIEYVKFDDERAVPRLVFREDALLDDPPDEYDVDWEIYRIERGARRRALEAQDVFAVSPRTKVVAEGDSWFNLPVPFRPPAIADQLSQRSNLRVNNIAYWGHTLERIVQEKEYLSELEPDSEYFILSAGGNDIQNGLENGLAISEYDPSRPYDQYLTGDGEAILEGILDRQKTLLAEVSENFPSVVILTHGYDYPRPLVGKGKYIGQYLREKNVPDDKMQLIVEPIIDKLNLAICEAAAISPAAQYLDCRGKTILFTWYDDMHPSKDGFRALADRFDDAIG